MSFNQVAVETKTRMYRIIFIKVCVNFKSLWIVFSETNLSHFFFSSGATLSVLFINTIDIVGERVIGLISDLVLPRLIPGR